jgi:hypothetical protein
MSKDGWRMVMWLLILFAVFWSAVAFQSCRGPGGPTLLVAAAQLDDDPTITHAVSSLDPFLPIRYRDSPGTHIYPNGGSTR